MPNKGGYFGTDAPWIGDFQEGVSAELLRAPNLGRRSHGTKAIAAELETGPSMVRTVRLLPFIEAMSDVRYGLTNRS